jgi:type I restriction enzyme, S subunit
MTKWQTKKTTLVKKGDFILSNSMSFGRPYIMMVDACIHDGWLTLQDIDKSTSKQFLYYLLTSDVMQNRFKNYSAGSGVQNLKKETVQEIDFEAPEKAEQERIVGILEVWDEYIEKLEQKIALKEQLKKGLMQRFFSVSSSDTKAAQLQDYVSSFSTGLNPRRNFMLGKGNNRYITIKNISNGSLNLKNAEFMDDAALSLIAKRSKLALHDVIMSSIGNIGEAYLLKSHPVGWNINESVFSLKPNQRKIQPEYLYYLVTSEFAKRFYDNHMTGSSFKSIKMKDLKSMPVKEMSVDEQNEIVKVLRNIDEQLNKFRQHKDNLIAQKKIPSQNRCRFRRSQAIAVAPD